jgi:hypothetical protein
MMIVNVPWNYYSRFISLGPLSFLLVEDTSEHSHDDGIEVSDKVITASSSFYHMHRESHSIKHSGIQECVN